MIYTRNSLVILAEAESLKQDLDPSIACAVVDTLSGWHPELVMPSTDSLNPSLTYKDQTEQNLNRSYLGLCQFLGASARDLGYKQDMEALLAPELNLEVGVKLIKLALLQASNRLDRALTLVYGHRGQSIAIRVFSKLKKYHDHLNSPMRPAI